jgi:Fe-S-cluster containining protein
MGRSINGSARDFIDAWWRGDAGPVPCGPCSACCHYAGIVVDEKRDFARLPHLLTERAPDGELVLQRRADGACAHLGDNGCTVYSRRPAVCRSFDCRVYAAMGLDRRCDDGHELPDWEFVGQTPRE